LIENVVHEQWSDFLIGPVMNLLYGICEMPLRILTSGKAPPPLLPAGAVYGVVTLASILHHARDDCALHTSSFFLLMIQLFFLASWGAAQKSTPPVCEKSTRFSLFCGRTQKPALSGLVNHVTDLLRRLLHSLRHYLINVSDAGLQNPFVLAGNSRVKNIRPSKSRCLPRVLSRAE
jgi:hypothetical protein